MYQISVFMGTDLFKIFHASGTNLLDALQQNSVPFSVSCGGLGRCGKCRARVEGDVTPMTQEERQYLTDEEIRQGIRLLCYCRIRGPVSVFIQNAEPGNLYQEKLHAGFKTGQPGGKGLGVAIDIGTTTLSVYLCDLCGKRLLAKDAALNPQRFAGADVIARMQYAMDHEGGLKQLSRLVREGILHLIRQVCAYAGRDSKDIKKAVVVGNPAMLHLLCEEKVETLSAAPFVTSFTKPTCLPSKPLGFFPVLLCDLWVPGCAGAFLGADIVAGVYASGIRNRRDGGRLFLDIGTNGEIVLAAQGRLLGCATAAGPAFEGGNIRFGMANLPGAIEKVHEENGRLVLKAIGNQPIKGVCGSGLMDAVAAGLDAGCIDASGRIQSGHPWTVLFEGAPAMQLTERIALTQEDVRQFQLAKGAMAAGMEVLLMKAGLQGSNLAQVVLAGGFGSHLNPHSACRTGLLEPSWEWISTAAGNTAAKGALLALYRENAMEEMAMIQEEIEYVELSEEPLFPALFIKHMNF
ncbi:MAG: ASKHA domain-containing protein [Christensenellales bacterium]